MTKAFYNTINLTARDLLEADAAALNQEQRILRFFIQQGRSYMCAPSAVCKRVFQNTVPLTSVRRAMTNLTNAGDLHKTEAKIQGLYGKPEHLWHVAEKWAGGPYQPEQGELL